MTASDYLCRLLGDYAPYRALWQKRVQRHKGSSLHQGAIARILAEYLWESGEVDESVTDLPRRLRDRVSRSLSGQRLSSESLRWFIGAFDMNEVHATGLWTRHRREVHLAETAEHDRAHQPVSRDAYRVRYLDEYHQLGPDGLPSAHETSQTVEALEPLSRYSFLFDSADARVEVLRGGQQGTLYPHPDREGIHGIDIHFPRTLAPGEATMLRYRTQFHYGTAPPREFRRVFSRPVETATLEVRFDPQHMPRQVHWGMWPDVHSEPDTLELVELGSDGAVQRMLTNAENVVAGFTWEW